MEEPEDQHTAVAELECELGDGGVLIAGLLHERDPTYRYTRRTA